MKIDAGKIPRIETDIKIGEPMRIGDRVLRFLSRITILKTDDGSILGGWANPLAVLVCEQNKEYVLSFTGKDFTIDQLIEMAPSLGDILNKDKGIHKVRIE
ncbi:MAG: hypothetical protein ACE14P_13425 [Methanotrichaceae archaeon]